MIEGIYIKEISAFQLKFFAIITMTIDHIAYAFLPYDSLICIIMRTIGKCTITIICYFIAEGYFHTKNMGRYISRLILFTAISHIPFIFFVNWAKGKPWGIISWDKTSVMFTLLCGLLTLLIWEKGKFLSIKIGSAIILCTTTWLVHADWAVWGVLMVLVFGIFHGTLYKQAIAFICVVAVMQLWNRFKNDYTIEMLIPIFGTILGLIVLSFYSGKKGASTASKWLFYVYYPIHFTLIFSMVTPFFWLLVSKMP